MACMGKCKSIIAILISTAMFGCLLTGCNKPNSNNGKTESDESIGDTDLSDKKTDKISGSYNISSFMTIDLKGANPNISINITKLSDSTISNYIEYIKVKDKMASGYKTGDKVAILIKFKNDVDISELSLANCGLDSSTNICTYTLTIDKSAGTYVTGSDFLFANNELDDICNTYAKTISTKITGSTWGGNKEIQRVKGYKLLQSYYTTNSKVNADDSVSLGKETSRACKAVNSIFKEYAYDIVYNDGTEKTICTFLILPNIYKTNSGTYKILDTNKIYNVGSFNSGEENDILKQFGSLSISKIDDNMNVNN